MSIETAWKIGRHTIQPVFTTAARLRVIGMENIPLEGPVVLAMNHFSWIDPPCFGAASPRVVRFLAKAEAHGVPGLGSLIRSFGTLSVRRGESDREAVRLMRQVLRDGEVLGLFVEGTRQTNGYPGAVQPGAAMAALQEDAPIVCGAIEGSQHWKPWNFHQCTVTWGEPIRFEGLAKNARGYREASVVVADEIKRLWDSMRK
jgi:1-acyl-sn-glycerol-3-phosphate acyltransferase